MGTYCLSGAVLLKAGRKVNNSLSGGALLNGIQAVEHFIMQAESDVNNIARFNFSGAYALLIPGTKLLIEEITSNLAAIYCITYDMGTYTSRVEAEDIINVLRDAALRGLSVLRDKKAVDFINGA